MTEEVAAPAPDGGREVGQLGGVEGAAFGVLVFVVGMLVVANAWGVVDAKLAAGAAAREAARAYVEAPSAAAAGAAASRAADEALAGYGRPEGEVALVEGGFSRCQRVTWAVRVSVPVVVLPLLGREVGEFSVEGRHSEVVDAHRSAAGLEGVANCA